MGDGPSAAAFRVVLGVSGGIAAYKAVTLTRRLQDAGCEVRVVMTDSARQFVGAATFAGVTGSVVTTSLLGDPRSVSPHTDLGRWADVVVVAPATAATLGRIAHGISGDVLTATVLATRAPVVVAPAMHTEMWEHPATGRTMDLLVSDGVVVVGPDSGPLAGGDTGPGRMADPDAIVAAVVGLLARPLAGTSVLVTAGGTREAIDPVRYLGNRSSGKMGHAIAEEAARRGADVTLVTASPLPTSPRVRRLPVESAQEMADAVAALQPDVAIMAAAVADFRPSDRAGTKLVRTDGPPDIRLEPTPDILAMVAARPRRPFLVGFAAETGGLDRAVEKASRKGVDFLVANDVTEPGSGFSVDTNRVTILWPDGRRDEWPRLSKREVAARILDLVPPATG